MTHPDYIEGKIYKALDTDFDIPDFIQMEIDLYLKDLNECGGRSDDCYREEMQFYIKWAGDTFTPEQVELLKNYYCRGGIFLG